MEVEHAGLEIVRRIRQELGNHCVRIVLRTGQPGQAPEQDVISSYDIGDDFAQRRWERAAARFQTTLFVALRSYRDLMTIESSKQGLEQVIDASADIFSQRENASFSEMVLKHLSRLSQGDGITLLCRINHCTTLQHRFPIALATFTHAALVGRDAEQICASPLWHHSMPLCVIAAMCLPGGSLRAKTSADSNEHESLLYIGEVGVIGDVNRKLLEVFSTNISIAYKNLREIKNWSIMVFNWKRSGY